MQHDAAVQGLHYLLRLKNPSYLRNFYLWPIKLHNGQSQIAGQISGTGPRSAVGNVSGYRCVSDCRSRGREFDPGPVPYFRGD